MYMDEGEIVRDFLQAKNHEAQVAILADRNLTSKGNILAILARNGVNVENYTHTAKRPTVKLKENVVLQLYKDGKNDSQIAKIAGCSPSAIRKWRKMNDLPANFKSKSLDFLEQQSELLMGLWESGTNDVQIAKIIGCSPPSIFRWRKRHGLPRNVKGVRHY